MSETEQQKRDRIDRTERDHSRNAPPPVLLIAAEQPADEPIDAPWHLQLAYPSKWYTPTTKLNSVVVVHATAAENPASSTAAFFGSSIDSGSTQGVVDSAQGFRCVPDNAVCAGAPPMNTTGLHCEQQGVESRSRQDWLDHIDEIDRLAYQTAVWCKTFGIPVVLLHEADLPDDPADAHGITYHAAVSNRYHQSTHQDPGPDYPWDVFMAAVQRYTEGDDVALTDEQAKALAEFAQFVDGGTRAVENKGDPGTKNHAGHLGWLLAKAAQKTLAQGGHGA